MQMSVGAALAAQALGRTASAGQTAAPATTKLKVDAYSRHLQWLRTADEVAEAVNEMGFDGLDITVRPYPGHVDPTKVAQDLPPFVNTIRKHGIEVTTITCPITDADSPNAEQILQTASSLGITHYWWGTFRYDTSKPVMEQLDALKPRVEKLSALNAKYKMKAMYHTYEGDMTVGAAIWDFLYVLKNFDPAYVSFHYDVGHMVVAGGGNTWALNLRAAGPYIGGVSAKDYILEENIDLKGGGPYAGQQLGGFGAGGPGAPGGRGGRAGRGNAAAGAAPGAPSAGVAGGNAAAGAVAAGPGAAAPAGGASSGDRENPTPAPAVAANAGGPGGQADGGAGGRGAAGRGAGGGGRGGRGAPAGRGGGGEPNPWRAKAVPLGEGMDNLPELAEILKQINFSGPVEIQAEYPNGGADSAQDKITLPREQVLGAMKRDLIVLRTAFGPSGLL